MARPSDTYDFVDSAAAEDGRALLGDESLQAEVAARSWQRPALGLAGAGIAAAVVLGVMSARSSTAVPATASTNAATQLFEPPYATAAEYVEDPAPLRETQAMPYGGAYAQPAAPAAPAACGGAGDDCRASGCCQEPGNVCYSKNADYATCRSVCQPGMIEEGDPWECAALGQPAPFEEGPGRCAWSGENCIAKKCCNDANMKCFQKDNYFAGCLFKPDPDWDDNTQLGEFRGWHQVTNPVTDGQLAQGSKLLCIAVQSPNNRVMEDQLIAKAQEMGIGIFGCDDHLVLQGAAAPETAWKSISNTEIFISIWNQVKESGLFWHNDWTVKADPDAVFFPARLKMHLEQLAAPKDEPIYLKNCDFKFRFQGSLEIFSEKAMELYYEHADECASHIGHEGGEDFYMMTCMDAMGVGAMEEDSMLYDKYATGEHLILDDISACENGWVAAIHPFRTVDVWEQCANAALQAEQAYAASH